VARVDYYSIEKSIQAALHDRLFEVTVVVEEELILAHEMAPWIGIYLERRTPSEHQYIAAGRRVDYDLQITVWCWCFAMESEAAVRARDELVGRVEQVLLEPPRNFGRDEIETSWIEGGQMPSGRVPDIEGFASGGEILLVVKVNATSEG
jgi:hypothetical protein